MQTVNAGSTLYVTATFKDKAGQTSAPASASWRAIDLATGTEMHPATELTPAASVEFAVPATVNAIIGASPVAAQETRRLIVTGVYDGGETVTGYVDYLVQNLEK